MQREREHTGALARISAQLEQLNAAIRADAPRVPRNEEHGLAGHDVGDLTIEQLTGTHDRSGSPANFAVNLARHFFTAYELAHHRTNQGNQGGNSIGTACHWPT